MFKSNIKPEWEDKMNANGGRWFLSFPPKQRKIIDELWLNTILACIGEAFGDWGDHICGVIVSIRKGGDRLVMWTTNALDGQACKEIGRTWKETLGIEVAFGYQKHQGQKRNTDMYTV